MAFKKIKSLELTKVPFIILSLIFESMKQLIFNLTLIGIITLISCSKQENKTMSEHKYTNDLINETSPYLLQHAHNPVDWKPWNEETLELAKKENKLIIISVGYAACHWCHVMEHESFENDSVAAIMNNHFINIKIDREERPDIDQVYMEAVQIMTGQGGWPLNCITLPDGRPIYGGTYFPKEQWKNILTQVANLYQEKPEEILEYAEKFQKGLETASIVEIKEDKPVTKEFLENTISIWTQKMDTILGGTLGNQNKFPMPNNYQYLLRYGTQANDKKILDYTYKTLDMMAFGGIYDQIGGGFARYSVDVKWHVPHFEKMLYDNAQLVSLYSEAFLASKNPLYKTIVEETLTFVERELMHESGAFYSSLDADSNDANGHLEEGAFYVWKEEELQSLIKDDFELFKSYYNINYYGYWEHDNYVLIRKKSDEEICDEFNISKVSLLKKVASWKSILLEARSKRERPRLDDKTLTSWNALMLKGYVDAYKAFGTKHYLDIALKNANFLKNQQIKSDGSLYHNYKEGKSTINGYLEDYATLAEAYLDLYEVTLDSNWLQLANQLTQYSIEHFLDPDSQMFFFTSNTDPKLITRKIEYHDNVIPASNSITAKNLFKLGHHFYNKEYLKLSKQMLSNVLEESLGYPISYSNWFDLASNFSGNFYEIAISGNDAHKLVNEINQQYIPNKLIAGSTREESLPLLESRFNEEQTNIYICVDGACQLPQQEVKYALDQIDINF